MITLIIYTLCALRVNFVLFVVKHINHFMNLLQASSVENSSDSFYQNNEIQPERPVIYICQIHFHPLFELDTVTLWFNLPET